MVEIGEQPGASCSVLFNKYYRSGQIKEEMGRECGKHGGKYQCI